MNFRREYPSLPMVGAGAVVVRGKKVLLLKRRRPPNQGLWAIPGGLVELGESPSEAAAREVEEETGYKVKIEGPLDIASDVHLDEKGRVKYHFVLVDYVARPFAGSLKPNDESSESGWFTLEEAERLEVSVGTREVVRKYFQRASLPSRRRQRKRSSMP